MDQVKGFSNKIAGITVLTLLLFATSCTLEKQSTTQEESKAAAFEPDAGGLSVDLSHSGKTQYQTCGENLVKNGSFETLAANSVNPEGWRSSLWVYTHDKSEREALLPKLQNFPARNISSEKSADGKNSIRIFCPETAALVRNGPKPDFSNSFSTIIKVSDDIASKKLLLKFKYITKSFKVPGTNNFGALVAFRGKGLDDKYIYQPFSMTPEWKTAELPFLLPAGTTSLDIQFRLYGCGEAFVDDVSLYPVAADEGVSIKLLPMSYIDNTFTLSAGQPGIIMFACKNEKDIKPKKPFAFLELPQEIKCLDSTKLCKIVDVENSPGKVLYKIDLNRLKSDFGKDAYKTWNSINLLLKPEVASSDTAYIGRYWYQDGDYKTSPMSFNIKVIPEIKGSRPSLFKTGTMFARENDFTKEGSISEIADFYEKSGFNTVHSGSSPEFSAIMKNKGIERYLQPFWLCNGYRIGQDKKPDGAKFIRPDGTPFVDAGMDAICPMEVYTKGTYYTGKVVPALRKIIVEEKRADSIMPNWEPYYYDFKGCFCPRCKEEFMKFGNLSKEDVEKVTPAELMMKYKDKWIRFRSIQHGKMMAVFEETINALGKEAGVDSHFIPEIAWSQLIESKDKHFAQYDPLDYIDKLPQVEPWGPYIFHSASKPYEYNTGVHLITFEAAREIKEFVARHVKDPAKRPKLTAFPHGLQCEDWVTEPEAIAFENILFFLNGWEGSTVYYFPRGYDARYWQALASANTVISKFENFVFKGKKIEGAEVINKSPMPEVNIPEYWSEGGNFLEKLPGLKSNKSLLRVVQYELDGKRLIAVGNFWEKGELFFTLKIKALPEGKYVLREPLYKRTYTNNKGNAALSSEDIANGITLHAGALRWVFFVLEPFDKNMVYGDIVTQEQMQSLLNKRVPDIDNLIKWEKNYRSSSESDDKLPDYSAIKEMEKGSLACRIEKSDNKIRVVLSAPGSVLSINPANGAKISSWKLDGKEIVCQDKDAGLSTDAFWWPAKASSRITSPYEFAGQDISAKSVSVKFKKLISESDCVPLAGMTILKTISLSEDGKKNEVSSCIINDSGSEKNFSFRYHNMISYLEQLNGSSGTAAMKNKDNPVVFKRQYMIKLFRLAAEPDKDLESCFPMDNISVISAGDVLFESPNFPFGISFDVRNEGNLYSYIFWDSGKQNCSTFEPLFKKVKLAPGKSWTASSAWTMITN
ncbi:MAG: hypothetical protein A2020_16195 [Lentisphaerae bacterium GWF2_45_14]|nr:MAG: hypothetical protein A2020_16195 [Lentisphaerae bacterium GWF2_45_14]